MSKNGSEGKAKTGKHEQLVVKSAARVLQVLEAFAEARKPMRLTEISRELGMPSSSSSVLLRSLEHLGYLSYNQQSRSFFPTQRVVFLGSWLEEESPDASLGALTEKLSQITLETVILGAESGHHVQYIRVVQGKYPVRYHVRAGTKRLLPAANLGIALLSRKDNDEIGKTIRSINANLGPSAKKFDLQQVMNLIGRYRRSGYIFEPQMIVPGAGVIATLLPTEPAMAIGLGGVIDRLKASETHLFGVLRKTIDEILKPGEQKP